MHVTEILYFTVTLFLALATLIKWKRRRDTIAQRLNRGLRGYVAAKSPVLVPGQEKPRPEDLIPV